MRWFLVVKSSGDEGGRKFMRVECGSKLKFCWWRRVDVVVLGGQGSGDDGGRKLMGVECGGK